MALRTKELKLIGRKIVYQGIVVGEVNDLDMSKQRFEFEEFLRNVEKGKYDHVSN